MNTSCEQFNTIDVINDPSRQIRWNKFSDKFKQERHAHIQSQNYSEKVFVHGDLGLDNILLSLQKELFIIDFADAVLAPIIYEHALMPFAFAFDPALLYGYFGDYNPNELAEMCLNGLLIHDFGGDIVNDCIGNPQEFQCLDDLRKKIILLIVVQPKGIK